MSSLGAKPSAPCRLCLRHSSLTVDAFITLSHDEFIHVVVYKLFSFWIKSTDPIRTICVDCLKLIMEFNTFYLDVQKSQTILSNSSKEDIHKIINPHSKIAVKSENIAQSSSSSQTIKISDIKLEIEYEPKNNDMVLHNYHSLTNAETLGDVNCVKQESLESFDIDKMEFGNFFDIHCELCTAQCNTLHVMFEHYRVVHNIEGYVTCCKTRLYNKNTIMKHLASHSATKTCPVNTTSLKRLMLPETSGDRDSDSDDTSSETDIGEPSRHEVDFWLQRDGADKVDLLTYTDLSKIPKFTWKNMDLYQSNREQFTCNFGVVESVKNVKDAIKCFQLFFDSELINVIIRETNKYAENYMIDKKKKTLQSLTKRPMMDSWKPVTENDIYVTLGIFMLMDIIRKPTLELYYVKKGIFTTPSFGDVMNMDRLASICKFLRFTNKNIKHPCPSRLQKIYPVIERLQNNFKSHYRPHMNVSIDESFTFWNGQLLIKKLLRHKFGIRSYELCDIDTGYLWSFTVDVSTRKSNNTNTILKLIEPLLKNHHTIWMNSSYNSPDLARLLKIEYQTDCVGTLNLNSKNCPKIVKEKKLKVGEIISQHSGPVTVMKWCSKQKVSMISTYHTHQLIHSTVRGKESIVPDSVLEYDKKMGSVDVHNQLLQGYIIEKKQMKKWYMRIFRRLLNSSIINSMIVYKENTGTTISQLAYRMQLVEELFAKYGPETDTPTASTTSNELSKRLTEKHFVKKIPPNTSNKRPTRRCVVCQKHNTPKFTTFCCDICNVGLCLENCFELYHSNFFY